MNIQWYPGHMTKARRAMKEDIKLVDLVIELVDARIPYSSRNPDIDELAAGKARMILLNKADLADEEAVRGWAALFEEKKLHAVCIDARNKGSLKQVQGAVAQACKEKTERNRRRGIMNRPIRAMVVGIPNVGKSTFINSFAGKACAKTGNKPGVTKGNQWIRLNKTLELLDTPGILWPRFEEEMVGVHLALIGSINDQILDKEEMACRLINILGKRYPEVIPQRYGSEAQAASAADQAVEMLAAGQAGEAHAAGGGQEALAVLAEVARKRACLLKGGELEIPRAAALLLDEFRGGKLGRISLERTEDFYERRK